MKSNCLLVFALMVMLLTTFAIGTASAAYNVGFVWNRATDWKAGTVVNATTGNPCTDAQGNPVWSNESLQITGGISDPNPWYQSDGTLMNWSASYRGAPCWARGVSTATRSPYISATNVSWDTYHASGSYTPAVTWTSPINGKISVSGAMQFTSTNYVNGSYSEYNMTTFTVIGSRNVVGVGGPAVIAKRSAAGGTWTILLSTTITPTVDGTKVDWNLTGLDSIDVGEGDQLRFTFMPSDWAAFDQGNWQGTNALKASEKIGSPVNITVQSIAPYNPGYVWNRTADYQDGTAENATTGNPCVDSGSSPVWRNESLQITGGLSDSSPWFKGDGTLMNSNVGYQGAADSICWAMGSNDPNQNFTRSPFISKNYMYWQTYHSSYFGASSAAYAPSATWTSPVRGKVSLSGTMQFESYKYVNGTYLQYEFTNWTSQPRTVAGAGGPAVIAKRSAADGTWTVLSSTNIFFPADYPGNVVDWNLTGLDNIDVSPGDQIRFTFTPSDWAAFDFGNWAGDNWIWANEKIGSPVNITLKSVDYSTPVAFGQIAIDPNSTWSKVVTVPTMTAGKVPVLWFRARLNTPTVGGSGVVLQLLVDDVPVANDSISVTDQYPRVRLLNKMPSFDPPGTSEHHSWYDSGAQAWTTIYSPTFSANWGGTGHDFEYLLDLTGLVRPGQQAKISFRFINGQVVQQMGLTPDQIAAAKLILDQVALGGMTKTDVLALNAQVQTWCNPSSVTVNPTVPYGTIPGERCYEIAWSGRPEPANSAVAFDNLTGWTVSVCGDATIGLVASVDQLLWRAKLAKLTYGGGTTDTTVVVTPPADIAIPGTFDAANIWVYGGCINWLDTANVDEQDKVSVQINVIVEDAAGREFAIKTNGITARYWNIQHGLLSPFDLSVAKFPMKFKRLVISGCKAPGARTMYIESISFYNRDKQPVPWTRPADAVFPINDEGIMPTSPAITGTTCTSVGQGADFASTGADGTLKFMVRPQNGAFTGVTAQWNSGTVFSPMQEGRVFHDMDGDPYASQPDNGTVTSSTFASDKLSVVWTYNNWIRPISWQVDYSLHGRTLVVDVKCSGGTAKGVYFGKLSGLSNPRGIEVPYLLMGDKPGPWIGCAAGLFVSVLPDWYNSDFHHLDTGVEQPTTSTIGLMGGTVYEKLSDGKRNDLRDRVLVTVSPAFPDTLPNSQNPVSPNRDRLAKYVFFNVAQWCPNYWTTMKNHGIDYVMADQFATTYVRSFHEYGYIRWRPRPDVTEAQLKAYFDYIRSLGYIPGSYLCATLNGPVNEYWDESKINTWADGSWVDGWYGSYFTNPSANAGLVRAVGQMVKEKYNVGTVFLDTYTGVGFWDYTYEANAEGAGMARHRVMGVGDACVEARKWYGSTMSEGTYHWLYAGLTDMDYATIVSTSTPADLPLLLDFDLLKIHPFEIGTMMGWGPANFLNADETNQLISEDNGLGVGSTALHKYISASLAYGHGFIMGYSYWPPLSRLIQYYGLFQGVQSEYLADNATEIRYHNGTSFVTISQALAANSARNRVKVTYSRGLIVYVNYNATANWTVTANGRSYVLPPYGWVIVKPGQILSYSALVGGNRVDYVQAPDYYYMNTGTSTVTEGPIDLNGAVYVKREGQQWRIIPCGDLGQLEGFRPTDPAVWLWDYRFVNAPANKGCTRIFVNVKTLVGDVAQVVVASIDESSAVVSSEIKHVGSGILEFPAVAGVREYRISLVSQSIAEIRGLADGSAVGLVGAQVSRDVGSAFYIESTDRTVGIRVTKPTGTAALTPGTLATITGIVITNSDGERCISAGGVQTVTGTPTIQPLGMTNKSLGGGDAVGQSGPDAGIGVNNVGLLVKVWGKSALVTGKTDRFTITDGSGSNVLVVLPAGSSHGWASAPGHVTVTGVVGLKSNSGVHDAVIYIAGMSEVKVG